MQFFFSRLFWIICITLSWIASILLIRASWDDFQNNAISFVVETSYLDWNTKFPSISICETENQEQLAEVTDQLFGDPHDYNLDEIIKELVFFKGLSFYTLQICGPNSPPNENCINNNFSIYSDLVRSKCEQIIKECKWNNKSFDCCKYFVTIDTELGPCYSINSMQSRLRDKAPYFPMISNRKLGPGTLFLKLIGNANIYILGEQEVPSLTTLATDILQVTPHIHFHRYMVINEIDNQPEVKDVSIEQRNCRFMDESDLDVYSYYSYSACCVQCRKDAQLKICNCTHHLIPNSPKDKHCDIKGLDCLNKNYNDLAVLKTKWAKRTGLVCSCIPSCTEIELSVVKDEKIGIQEEIAIVELSLERLPTERYKRKVVRGKLDLVVSMGGTTALFLGASILSFVEIFYYFFIRATYNFIVDTRNKRRNEEENFFLKEQKNVFLK